MGMYPEARLEFSSPGPQLVYNTYLAYILYDFVLMTVNMSTFVVSLGRF